MEYFLIQFRWTNPFELVHGSKSVNPSGFEQRLVKADSYEEAEKKMLERLKEEIPGHIKIDKLKNLTII